MTESQFLFVLFGKLKYSADAYLQLGNAVSITRMEGSSKTF